MFIPLHDTNHLRYIKHQYVTLALIGINVLVFLITSTSSESAQMAAVLGLGYIPSVVHDINVLPPGYEMVVPEATYLTYSFLHADWWHLAGNMLFLWVFGDNVEDAMGHLRYLFFYLACAVAGAFFHGLMAPESSAPLIGASGSVAGIVAAYLMLHPRVKVWVLAFGRIPLRLPAWIVLVAWIAMQVVMFALAGEDQVSWAAHIGGIVAGALLVLVLRRKGVPLFDREIVSPQAVETAPQPAAPPLQRAEPTRWGRQ
jgi:membrane associated rhomboid family serine protease